MERSLLYGALALGCVGYACGVALVLARSHSGRNTRDRSIAPGRAFVVTAVLLPIVVFLATLPYRPPFAPGHGFGSGFAIGAVGALLAAWLVVQAQSTGRDTPLFGAAISAGPLSMSVAAAGLSQLLLHDVVIDALSGTAIGWFAVTIMLIAGLISARREDAAPAQAPLPLVSAAGFTVAVCGISALGAYRGGEEFASAKWSAAGLALASGVPFAVYICSLTAPLFARIGLKTPFPRLFTWLTQRLVTTEDGRAAAARVWRAIAATAILLVLAKLLSSRALDQPHLFTSAVAGALAGWVCWWLVAEGRAFSSADESAPAPQFVPIAVLLVLGVAVVAFNQLAGFGIAVATVSAWLSFAMAQAFVLEGHGEAPETSDAQGASLQGLLHLLLFATGFLMYRFVTTRFSDDLKGVGLADQYGMAGFLTGAATPVLLAALLPVSALATGNSTARTLSRLMVAGLLTLAVPGLAILLWRSKVALALIAGLSLAIVAPLWSGRSSVRSGEGLSIPALFQALFALGAMLALGQWTHHVLGFASLTRDAKVSLVTWIVGGLIAAILVLDFGGRFASRLANRGAASPTVAGGAGK